MPLIRTSLVTNARNVPLSGDSEPWGPKQRRAYQRLLSGLHHHISQGHTIRVLTLTSVPDTDWRDLNKNFQILRKRIEHKWGKMEYWRLRSYEGPGAGVLHILYSGPWIPQKWLSWHWEDITDASIVYIQQLKGRRGSKRIASYMISHYMMHHDIFRQSWSWGWVFRGFVGYWSRVKLATPCLGAAIILWRRMMSFEDPKRMLRLWFGEYWKATRFSSRPGSLGDVVILS